MTKDEAKDIKHYFAAVTEDLRSEIRLVADGVAVNAERIEALQGETRAGLERVDARLDRVEGEMRKGFRELGERVGGVEGEVRHLGERVGGVEGELRRPGERVGRVEAE